MRQPSLGRLFNGLIADSPAMISRSMIEIPFVAGELAVRPGADLPPRDTDHSVDQVLAAIGAIKPAIEFAEAMGIDAHYAKETSAFLGKAIARGLAETDYSRLYPEFDAIRGAE